MTPFATDIDLLHWEPNLMNDAGNVAQTLISGTGALSGSTFTISSGSFTDAHVSSEHVILLSGSVSGSFPIFSVNSTTSLSLSVLHDAFDPDEGSGSAWAPGAGTGIVYTVRTFLPQRKLISDQLLQAAGVDPSQFSSILNPANLRRPCALGTLQLIYTALAAATDKPEALLNRAALYERLYNRSLRTALVEIDRDGDGITDLRRSLSVVELRRR